jgi:hypothetical protein
MGAREMHRVNGELVLAEHTAAADDDLELVVFVKVRADDAFVIAFNQKRYRLFLQVRAGRRRQEIGTPAESEGHLALNATGFDVFVCGDLEHDD